MSIEQSMERQAVALEKIAEELKLMRETAIGSNVGAYFEAKGKEEAKTENAPAPKKTPAKKLPPVKEETPKEPTENPMSSFDPAKEFVADVKPAVVPTPVAPAQADAPKVTPPQGPTVKDVISSLEQYSKDFGEDQAYNLLISFKVAKVSDLTVQQRKDLLDKVQKLRSLNL